ncbi:MarR family winged helix-turn-helix transcriptional regulator [Geomesophilobacter sediminis]|uniref:MarR family transcriptional regulator n=1 Tax=Geomesophilobacter sediminis TaxID=2798584 RepID=A0A8J7JCJ6_9BACT|nr:MarR family transcriptional regulator [Geomesophilobacter sediminis]MBJ6725046.1 MarR family transcriptional regulator [Geomesophilobacter sediminis]
MTTPAQRIDKTDLLFSMVGLSRRWRQVLDAEFQTSGLTDATWRPLLHLDLLGDGVRQKDLAASLGLEGPSLVRLLGTLVAKGLVARIEDERDRRAKQLSLTDRGRAVVHQIRAVVEELEETLFASFDAAELEQLTRFVARLDASVHQIRGRSRG